MNLHNQMMNIQTVPGTYNDIFCYKLGHRDARHAAAELALKYDELIEKLEFWFSKEEFDEMKKECGL